MELSICSYSFHRLLEAGQQDVFQYINDCQALGCTQLDLWNGHLPSLLDDEARSPASFTPEYTQLSADELEYIVRIKATADNAGLPFGCLAVDGAHIYEASPEARRAQQIKAYRWLNIAEQLSAHAEQLFGVRHPLGESALGPYDGSDNLQAIQVADGLHVSLVSSCVAGDQWPQQTRA